MTRKTNIFLTIFTTDLAINRATATFDELAWEELELTEKKCVQGN